MLAKMLNTPIAELAMRDEINAGDDFLDGGTLEMSDVTNKSIEQANLFLFDTIFENILDHQTSCLT